MKTKVDYAGPSEEWLKRTDEIEATCLSVAAAGLAAELGMIDQDQLRLSREASEPVTATAKTAPTTD